MKKLTKQEIRRLKKSHTFREIAKMFEPPITDERVRQIYYEKKKSVCKKHKIKYTEFCPQCSLITDYQKYLTTVIKPGVFKMSATSEKYTDTLDRLRFEIIRLSKKQRSKDMIIQRALLIKYMKDKLPFNFIMIAKLLERDYTSIVNLYRKKI